MFLRCVGKLGGRCRNTTRIKDQDANLTVGIIGQAKSTYKSTALGIADATMAVMRDFCTSGTGCAAGRAPVFDEALFEHMRTHIHSTTVDSAANEIVAAQDMAASQPGREFAQLPNHKLIVRDRAHGSRRTLQRPWAADPYLDAIVTSVVLGPSSICQLIQRSDDFRAWYFSCTSASNSKGVKTCFRNLRAALHRYETLVTPISRCLAWPMVL